MGAGKVKNQHFVSRFYLEHFADDKNSIFAFDILRGESFRTSTDNVASVGVGVLVGDPCTIQRTTPTRARMSNLVQVILISIRVNEKSTDKFDSYSLKHTCKQILLYSVNIIKR